MIALVPIIGSLVETHLTIVLPLLVITNHRLSATKTGLTLGNSRIHQVPVIACFATCVLGGSTPIPRLKRYDC